VVAKKEYGQESWPAAEVSSDGILGRLVECVALLWRMPAMHRTGDRSYTEGSGQRRRRGGDIACVERVGPTSVVFPAPWTPLMPRKKGGLLPPCLRPRASMRSRRKGITYCDLSSAISASPDIVPCVLIRALARRGKPFSARENRTYDAAMRSLPPPFDPTELPRLRVHSIKWTAAPASSLFSSRLGTVGILSEVLELRSIYITCLSCGTTGRLLLSRGAVPGSGKHTVFSSLHGELTLLSMTWEAHSKARGSRQRLVVRLLHRETPCAAVLPTLFIPLPWADDGAR
jgi:hypothetical protein